MTDQKFTVTIGFIEIYNESINDLLTPSAKNLQLIENSGKRQNKSDVVSRLSSSANISTFSDNLLMSKLVSNITH